MPMWGTDMNRQFVTSHFLFSLPLALCMISPEPSVAQLTKSTSHEGQRLDSVTVLVPIHRGWNLLSNPVQTPNDTIAHLFPTCTACVMSPWPTWRMTCTLPNGMGIGDKCSGSSVSHITGLPIDRDSIPVIAGWNLIGSITYPVPTTAVRSNPPGVILSPIFYHSGSYVVTDTIRPGFAYWVKVSTSGAIILDPLPH
jgi:hypothetical protein